VRRVRDYGLLRGNAKKLRLQIQLMLAVACALFQVAESPIIAEVKRKLATTWARKAQESGYYCMRTKDGRHPQFDAKRWRHVG
jgi:hypothetical protein